MGESATLALAARARSLREAGVDLCSFTAGEPDFDTPESIKEACRRALADGKTKYTPVEGIAELRHAIAEDSRRHRTIPDSPRQVIVTPGAKMALYQALLATVGPGDEVLIPAPYWVSYVDMVRLCDATPVVVPLDPETGFTLEPDALRRVTTSRTRLLVHSSPHNPTGAIQSEAAWREAIAALPEDVLILSDEIYATLVYDGRDRAPSVSALPEARERTIVVDGVSKSHAMTGWRIGWAIGPQPIVDAMRRIQSHTASNAPTPSQWAALEALTGGDPAPHRMRKAFEERRDVLVAGLRALPGVRVTEPQGAFYAFPDVRALLSEAHPDTQRLCAWFLEEAHVAVVPGEAFGAPGFVRFSFATDLETIRKGLDRLHALFEQWRP